MVKLEEGKKLEQEHKLDWVVLLVADPPRWNSTTLDRQNFKQVM